MLIKVAEVENDQKDNKTENVDSYCEKSNL